MDAQHLGFPDRYFDAVVAQYVITTVPDPELTLDEFARVVRPGGEIILVNHLGAEAGPRRLFEQGFAPVARRLGWRPEFRWERLARWAERHGGVRVVERRAMPPMGHFSLIRFERVAAGANGQGRAGAAGGLYVSETAPRRPRIGEVTANHGPVGRRLDCGICRQVLGWQIWLISLAARR